MKKSRRFRKIKFTVNLVKEAIALLESVSNTGVRSTDCQTVDYGDETCSFSNLSEFYTNYQSMKFISCSVNVYFENGTSFSLSVNQYSSDISVKTQDVKIIDRVFRIFDNAKKDEIIQINKKVLEYKISKVFKNVRFNYETIKYAIDMLKSKLGSGLDFVEIESSMQIADETWYINDIDDLIEAYKHQDCSYYRIEAALSSSQYSIGLKGNNSTEITIVGSKKSDCHDVLSIFKDAEKSGNYLKTQSGILKEDFKIFIGHGRNNQWEKLKSHLMDKHNYRVEAYETGNRAGHSIRDILETMGDESSMAFLILTGEDKTETGIRARQNVIHECGLFQGKLGYHRAIMVVEHGVELASNFDGIQQLRFKKGRISEIFGDAVATISREFS